MTIWNRRDVRYVTAGFLATVSGSQELDAVETELVDRESDCDADCRERDLETSTGGDGR